MLSFLKPHDPHLASLAKTEQSTCLPPKNFSTNDGAKGPLVIVKNLVPFSRERLLSHSSFYFSSALCGILHRLQPHEQEDAEGKTRRHL